jgi:hypothetical protein
MDASGRLRHFTDAADLDKVFTDCLGQPQQMTVGGRWMANSRIGARLRA